MSIKNAEKYWKLSLENLENTGNFEGSPGPLTLVDLLKIVFRAFLIKEQKEPPEVFYKKGVLKNFVNFAGKHLW